MRWKMRTRSWFTMLVVAALMVFMAASAHAGWRHCTGTTARGPNLSETILLLDDQPNHTVRMVVWEGKIGCSCPEIDGATVAHRDYYDMTPAGGSYICYWTILTQGTDKIFGTSKGSWKVEAKKDGSWESTGSGELEYYGGTGKLEGLKGKGAVKSKRTPTAVSITWEADVYLPD